MIFWSEKAVQKRIDEALEKHRLREERDETISHQLKEAAAKDAAERAVKKAAAEEKALRLHAALPKWGSAEACTKCLAQRPGPEGIAYRRDLVYHDDSGLWVSRYDYVRFPPRMRITCKCGYWWDEAPADDGERTVLQCSS